MTLGNNLRPSDDPPPPPPPHTFLLLHLSHPKIPEPTHWTRVPAARAVRCPESTKNRYTTRTHVTEDQHGYEFGRL